MRIAVFYPDTPISVWSLSKGIVTTLARMGHDIVDTPHSADAIIVSGPEYLWRSLRIQYPKWDTFKARKYGWLHETVGREDYGTNPIAVGGKLPVQDLKDFVQTVYTPSAEDTTYGLKYLPFGVDETVFFPSPIKDNNILFIGSMYAKRRKFIEKYPSISIRDYKDFLTYKSNVPLDEYIRLTARASAVLNLPMLSCVTSTRVYEAMACKALTITPFRGNSEFIDGKHLVYYRDSPADAMELMELHYDSNNVWSYSLSDRGREIAEAGYQEVIKNHTLESRLEKILK
jgi:hypothetical protein